MSPELAIHIEQALEELGEPKRSASFAKFIQAVPGGYGEGDQCLGVSVPQQRIVAKTHASVALTELRELLRSRWHECRLTGVFILVRRYELAIRVERKCWNENAGSKRKSPRYQPTSETAEEIVDFYLKNLSGINNWDLVDASAYKILGDYLVDHPKHRFNLNRLADSDELWQERIAVVATLSLIKNEEYGEILELAARFLEHPHDLMHKAVGWMLRELGKRNLDLLRGFLHEHSAKMPRTMLRYSIEKMSATERKRWLQ
ncbi:MAG: DNA alkylation repair protein [Planctomycetota bacterium]